MQNREKQVRGAEADSMRQPITLGGVTVNAGERRTIDLPIASLYSHNAMSMPVHVIHGKKEGPRLFISAAIHGDEINGVEIVRRLLRLKLLKLLKGTLIAIPIVNVYGFINKSRYLPDRRDLNRSFPGSYKGSLASNIARLFMDEIVDKCTHGIDIHTGANHRNNLPQLRVFLGDPEVERLAYAFNAPVIINARMLDNSLREAVIEKGIPIILYEAGECLRFNEHAIQFGLKGIISVMRELGMLPKKTGIRKTKREPIVVEATSWVRAPKSGIIYSSLQLGSTIKKDEVIASIFDPFGENEEKVISPVDGVIIGILQLPLVHKGDALFHIAPFEKISGRDHLAPEDFAEELNLENLLNIDKQP